MRTVIQYQTTFYNSGCMWKAARTWLEISIFRRDRGTVMKSSYWVPNTCPVCLSVFVSLRRME